jgi:RHS repeat-associated protein
MQVYGETETNTYYYLKDHLGSVIGITDESGNLVESYTYDAWGNVTVYDASGTEISESAIGNRYTFQGREISWATGLYYFRARWYDATTGRFLSKDPIGISGGLNQYVFVGNNPVNFIDPTGLCPEDDGANSPWFNPGLEPHLQLGGPGVTFTPPTEAGGIDWGYTFTPPPIKRVYFDPRKVKQPKIGGWLGWMTGLGPLLGGIDAVSDGELSTGDIWSILTPPFVPPLPSAVDKVIYDTDM